MATVLTPLIEETLQEIVDHGDCDSAAQAGHMLRYYESVALGREQQAMVDATHVPGPARRRQRAASHSSVAYK